MTSSVAKPMIRVYQLLLFVLIAISPFAWARTSKTPVEPPTGVFIAVDSSRLKSIEMAGIQITNLGNAERATASAVASNANMPGYSPAAGIIGTIIGLGIVKGMEQSAARKKANKPIEILRTAYENHWQELKLDEAIVRSWDALSPPSQRRCVADAAKNCLLRLTLRPELQMVSDGRVLTISIDAFRPGNGQQLLHVRKVNYLSQPTAATNMEEINAYWSNNNLNAIAKECETAIGSLMALLLSELDKSAKTTNGSTSAIRFVNSAGLFYDRGSILSQNDHRIIYRSLDGNITSAYLDHLLSTEDYYNWIPDKSPPQSEQQKIETTDEPAVSIGTN